MIPATFRPLERPLERPAKGYRRPTFSASFGTTLNDLERELRHLGAEDIIIEIDLQLEDIRNDGWPRSSARPASPGVRLSFQSQKLKQPLAYPCSTFNHWEQNLRAIALTLHLQRRMADYAVGRESQRYSGFSALPPAASTIAAGEWTSVSDAVRFLARIAGWIEPAKIPPNIGELFRAAAMNAHPDQGGTDELMSKVNRAREFIEAAKP